MTFVKISILLTTGVLLSVTSGCIGAMIALRFDEAHTRESSRLLKAGRLEIFDDQGKLSAVLGSGQGGPFLRFLSPSGQPMISLEVQTPTREREKFLEDTGLPKDIYPSPLFRINNQAGRASITLTTVRNGYGLISFDALQQTAKTEVGYIEMSDDENNSRAGMWGIAVNGSGGSKGIGLGQMSVNGGDGRFVTPHTESGR